jgi:SecD/SecF fusion protein
MRNKNTIITLLVIFSAICLWNLFHTWRAFSIEGDLNSSETVEERAVLEADKDLMGSYRYSQRNAFSLGLDLQGGLFVTMEVGVEDILRQFAGSSIDEEFTTAMDRALEEKKTSQENLVDLFYKRLIEVYKEKNKPVPQKEGSGETLLLSQYFSSRNRDIGSNLSDEEIIARLLEETESAVENTFSIIRSRIDQFGVASPNLQLQTGTGRILLELPGVKDPRRVIKLLRGSAKLEFRETVTYSEAYPVLQRINRISQRIQGIEVDADSTDEAPAPAPTGDSTAQDSGDVLAPADDASGDTTGAADEQPMADAGDTTSNDTAEGDINDLFGEANATASSDTGPNATADPALSEDEQIAQFKEENPFLGLFNLRYQLDPNRPLVGIVALTDTAAMNKWLRNSEIQTAIPSNIKFLWEAKPNNDLESDFADHLGLIAIATNASDKAPMEGDVITTARQDYEPNTTNAMVTMNMNSEGAKEWARLTKENVGKSVAIVLDDLVQSYPNVQGMISGGRSQITGNFNVEEAKDLANLLRAGALPVKAKILGKDQIGPTLGAENLNKGLRSFFIAFLITIVFMFLYYRSSGLIADVALAVNLIYILGVSAALNVVFTLPGLAAVVLTMGMAVDANVLIFERIKEEQNAGKSFKAAISSGFKSAFSSVMDANITTFLTGLILFSFGIGPIRGFAVSLMIGIVTSLICALFITRLFLEYYARKGNDSITFGSKSTMALFKNTDIKMTVRKRVGYIVSTVLVIGSIASIAALGFKTGVDFQGGRQYKVEFAKEVSADDVRKPLTEAFGGNAPVIRTLSAETNDNPMLLITTSYRNEDDNVSEELEDMLESRLNESVAGAEAKIVESTRVGPTVANDIRRSAVYSVIFSLLVIFLYILVRFRRYQFSLGAIAALFHDVTIVLGIFSFLGVMDLLPFSLEVDQAFIAAVLTIIGYSINDTVVVFDRIRENFGQMKSSHISDIFNISINQTLSRTLMTSVTTIITILILLIFAGDVIRGFMFALLVGIIVGTYSSIFVASPISHDLIRISEGDTPQAPKKSGSKGKKKPNLKK